MTESAPKMNAKNRRRLMNAKGRRRLAVLERRANFLEDTIESGIGSAGSLGHYASELSALDWAIDLIRDHYQLAESEAR